MNREVLSFQLSRKGYTTEVAEGGRQALELIGKHPFDLVLLDLTMPEMSGFEVLGIIRETYAATELPVIMVTSRDACEVLEEEIERLKQVLSTFEGKSL